MAAVKRVNELVNRSWPEVTGGGMEAEAKRSVLKEAYDRLDGIGLLEARIVGLVCPECRGLRGANEVDPPCPRCGNEDLVTFVHQDAWENAVCRVAGLPEGYTTKGHARAHYGRIARKHQFESWWSGLETRLVPIATALFGSRVFPAELVGHLRNWRNGTDETLPEDTVLVGLDGKPLLKGAELHGQCVVVVSTSWEEKLCAGTEPIEPEPAAVSAVSGEDASDSSESSS